MSGLIQTEVSLCVNGGLACVEVVNEVGEHGWSLHVHANPVCMFAVANQCMYTQPVWMSRKSLVELIPWSVLWVHIPCDLCGLLYLKSVCAGCIQ